MTRTSNLGYRLAATLAAALVAGIGFAAEGAQARTASGPVVFPGNGLKVTMGHQPKALQRTSPSFRGFLREELDELWGWDDKRAVCRSAPVVFVQEFRTRVAFLNEGVYAAPHHAECAQGGHWQFAVRREGRWISPRALGGQDVPSCHRLRKWGIPRMTGAEKCYDGTAVVDYEPVRATL